MKLALASCSHHHWSSCRCSHDSVFTKSVKVKESFHPVNSGFGH